MIEILVPSLLVSVMVSSAFGCLILVDKYYSKYNYGSNIP